MAKLREIVEHLDAVLDNAAFSEVDDSLNGLQVEGAKEVQKVSLGVDACLELSEKAASEKADLILVHHGFFWGSARAIIGPFKNTISSLIENNISLYATHLPLDAHPTYGNNQVLQELLELDNSRSSADYKGRNIGRLGLNSKNINFSEYVKRLSQLEGAGQIYNLNFGPEIPERVMTVSGGAADCIRAFNEEGFDTLITGEPKQFVYHFAKENKLNLICAGHYATETLGVKALGKMLEEKFKIESKFINIPTGI